MRKSLGDGWEVDELARDSEGRIFSRYWHNGKQAIRHELGGPRAKRYAGYTLIQKDLLRIIAWISHTQELAKTLPERDLSSGERPTQGDRRSNEIMSGLLVAIVTTYGKLFSQAEGRKVKLESNAISDVRQLQLHNQLLKWRNTYSAHSGVDSPERSVVHMEIGEPINSVTSWRLSCESSQPSSLIEADYTLASELANVLLGFTEEKRALLLKELTIHEANDTEVLAALALHRKAGRKFSR